ncbi:phosphoenolpyruvate carboxylase [bacterium]|nr:phosphoenolpyruvate carboxylase [bacterium]
MIHGDIASILSRKLDEGFSRISSGYAQIIHDLGTVLRNFGLSDLSRVLPNTNSSFSRGFVNEISPQSAVSVLSLSMQLLNVIEQKETQVYRLAISQSVGAEYVSGSMAEVVNALRLFGVDWIEIRDKWRSLALEVVFTAHPTESRRPSLINQLRLLFDDRLSKPISASYVSHIEALFGTGEFIQNRPSVQSEREFITELVSSTLPAAISVWIRSVQEAFVSMGCPDELVPKPSDFPRLKFRSWVSSDRDGHPNVTAEETRQAIELNITQCTAVIHELLIDLANQLTLSRHRVSVPVEIDQFFIDRGGELPEEPWRERCLNLAKCFTQMSIDQLLAELAILRDSLVDLGAKHMANTIDIARQTVSIFEFNLVGQDIRQNSQSYRDALTWLISKSGGDTTVFLNLTEEGRQQYIAHEVLSPRPFLPHRYELQGPAKDAVESLRVVSTEIIKHPNSIGSIIVSMTRSASDLLQVLLIAREADLLIYPNNSPIPICPVPIVPLFETVDDHQNAVAILTDYLNNPVIIASLTYIHNQRGGIGKIPVRVMCGHSDGGKDAGIFSNFITMRTSRIKISEFLSSKGYVPIFFEGIGGTLIRGAAPIKYLIANSLANSEIAGFEYTEQGQVIAQNHLVPSVSAWSIESAFAALLFREHNSTSLGIPEWIEENTHLSTVKYKELLNSPDFFRYFYEATPLDALEYSRMGSRPIRRTGKNTLADLRAIPFALAQSQSRFNLTGWYGIGTMFQKLFETYPNKMEALAGSIDHYPALNFALTNVEMAHESASVTWMQRYSKLVTDGQIGASILTDILSEYSLTRYWLHYLFKGTFEERRPRLSRTIRRREPVLKILHEIQCEQLSKWRKTNDVEILETLLMTINAISNALRGTG